MRDISRQPYIARDVESIEHNILYFNCGPWVYRSTEIKEGEGPEQHSRACETKIRVPFPFGRESARTSTNFS